MVKAYKEIIKDKSVYVPVESNVEDPTSAKDMIYKHLKELSEYNNWNLQRNYISEEYPFVCDFYVSTCNLYIECQFEEQHGLHPYNFRNKKDNFLADEYKETRPDIYNTWVVEDTEKRRVVSEKRLHWIEIFQPDINILDILIDLELNGLRPNFTDTQLEQEFNDYSKHEGKLSVHSRSNYIIKTYQHQLYDCFNEIYYGHVENKWNLVMNRSKYRFKPISDLTKQEMLHGLEIVYPSVKYSMFNPKLIKWFAEHENMTGKICYDPTGGWGHRMLGGQSVFSKYIYNDLSHDTVEAVKKIKDRFNMDNCIIHEGDAMTYYPKYDYDCMFTCPPYYSERGGDTEIYQCDGFESKEQFDNFINHLYNLYKDKESCKSFGLVIREDMLPDNLKEYIVEKYFLKTNNSHFVKVESKTTKKYNDEYLYIFRK